MDKFVLQLTAFISTKNKATLQGNYMLSKREKKGLYLMLCGFVPLLPIIALSAIFNSHDTPELHELINQISLPFGIIALTGLIMHNTRIFAKKEYQAQRLITINKKTQIKSGENQDNVKNELNLTLDDLQQNRNSLNYNNEQEKEHQ